ncbi:MAG: hypothetical protein COW30_15635 [Rhodospirillales bacterium CG15_BIG_FIL_POST_REV_8_21_14_020_66_15]|nr:MAG: hypothetical protein COW30_15635 [Rhodospirillales bacterium CG15_BIG_FIL_POST_REV_8_21_14_020_66_15]
MKSLRIKRVFDYWIALRRERMYPAWTDVKLMDIYDVAPFLAVLDVEAVGGQARTARFSFRFCGTWLVEGRSNLAPADPTGRFLDDIAWPFNPRPLLAACDRVLEGRRPALLAVGDVDESVYHQRERAFFPLGPKDDRVTQILVCVDEVGAD